MSKVLKHACRCEQQDSDVTSTINGPFSLSYTRLVALLGVQLSAYVCLDTPVHAMTENTEDQRQAFLFEISDLLRTLDYPDEKLLTEPLDVRLSTLTSRQHVLNFLTSELIAEKLISRNKSTSTKDDPKELEHALKTLMEELKIKVPLSEVDQETLFSKLSGSIKSKGEKLLFPLDRSEPITSDQWSEITRINAELSKEYRCRRAMVLKRLDVTIQSFLWSDRAKSRKDEIDKIYSKYRPCLTSKCDIDMGDLLSSSRDLLDVDKTSCDKRREKLQCSVNKFKIGNVPDRGGRVNINDAPPPEQPAFRSRQDAGDNRGRGGSGGGRGFRGQGRGAGGGEFRGQRGQRGGQHGGGGGEFRGDTGWKADNQLNQSSATSRSFYGSDFKSEHGDGGYNKWQPGRGQSDRGQHSFNRGQHSYNRGQSDRGQNSFNRGQSDRGANSYSRGQSNSDRGQSNSDRGQSNYDRGQSAPGRGQYGGNQNRGRYAPRSAGPY